MTSTPPSPAPSGPTPASPRVILCDDHVAIRAGLRAMLERDGMQVVGECSTAVDLMNLAQAHPLAVVITDLGVDDLQFPELMAALRSHAPGSRVVVYSMRETPAIADLCYQAGATAFVPKSAEFGEVTTAVRMASQGQSYVPAMVVSELITVRSAQRNPRTLLSAKDLELFTHYAEGHTVPQLAQALGLSEKTVQNRLTHISKTLAVARSAFHVLAREYGLTHL
ncbi:MAG: response regulator transcription factor [Pseudomonadota bacterium]